MNISSIIASIVVMVLGALGLSFGISKSQSEKRIKKEAEAQKKQYQKSSEIIVEAQKEIKNAETKKTEVKSDPLPPSGDSVARLQRFNKLYNNQPQK